MAPTQVLSHYVKKLSHPLKEIRERSLQLLIAKLQLGWELDDELSGTREMLEALLAWFHVQQPSLQKEALTLLCNTIKTKTGTYIVKEFGINKILSTLNKIKNKINPDAIEIYNDFMESLRFLNTVSSEENVVVPALSLHSLGCSESDESSSGYYNLGIHVTTSKETSLCCDEAQTNQINKTQPTDGVRVLLFPWVDVCASDSKTILLIEDALKSLKSTRRCCKFIRDVFLRDFPPDIFLNRPAIIKHLVSISEGDRGGHPGEALHVLLCITRSLRARIRQLNSLELIHDNNKITDDQKESEDRVNAELEQIAGYGLSDRPTEDVLVALRQLPAPLYALDTMHAVLSAMARNVVLVEPGDKAEFVELKDSNTCLSLIESLTQLLLDCVTDKFWCAEHSNKTHRDIVHKSCMVMRLLGDLLTKYRSSFLAESSRWPHRVSWLRLVDCSARLLHWARHSALPPCSLAVALQAAQLDPAVDVFYPELATRVAQALQNSKITADQEYKTKYRELTKLLDSMEKAAQFMRNKNSQHTKEVLTCIKASLPALEMHQSESYLDQISDILLWKTREFEMDDSDWSVARSIALSLMAHHLEWVKTRFYSKLAEMVRTVLISDADEVLQADNEKCLTLLCDVGVLTEICCHGLSSESKEIESSASTMMVYLLRGRLVVSERCWWRVLASLLPVLPLLHVYGQHDTLLGQAICKSLELDIASCMGVSLPDVTAGLVRLLFVRCPSVQLDAAHSLCQILDDEKYLPPKEALRTDVLISALRRVEPQDFNVDHSGTPSRSPQTTGLLQILDVLKQDITLDEHGSDFTARTRVPTLEPSLRRSTLQQLAVLMQQQGLHDTFVQCNGLNIIMVTLRMSMMVDDYLAYPECAISCVSILNSVCFLTRHVLAKTPDLLTLLLRAILIFPANDSLVAMSSQLLALTAWSGFALQELDASRRRVPALPLSVTQRVSLPFHVNSYWNTSTNSEHSSFEWLVSDVDFLASIRTRWWLLHSGGAGRVTAGAALPPAPLPLRPLPPDLCSLRSASPLYACTKLLMDLDNATSHRQVHEALNMLESYTHLVPLSSVRPRELSALPWHHTRRFLCAPPASSRDTALLVTVLQYLVAYLDNVTDGDEAGTWMKSSFLNDNSSIIALLSRSELYPQQTSQDSIEVTQLHIHIVKVLLRCIILWGDDFDSTQMEFLVKILLACLEKVDLKNFHMLGYLNELVRTIRYAVNSSSCKLSEDTLVQSLQVLTATLTGCACGGGRKGQACRLDALLALLALIRQIQMETIPVQRWSEVWSSAVVAAVAACGGGARPELRAAALRLMAALARHAQLLPQLAQAVPGESLSLYASAILVDAREANAVRTGAALLLAAITARHSPHSDVLEIEILEQLKNCDFLESAIGIFVEYCKENERKDYFEPNVPLSLLERRSELEVRASKSAMNPISPRLDHGRGGVPPTASLVAATADVLYNLSLRPNCPVQAWNERGLYRILFRCASWYPSDKPAVAHARASACRALSAVCGVKCARATLANTKDCLYNLLLTMTPVNEDDSDTDGLSVRAQAFNLLASLLSERAASDTVWSLLREPQMATFFVALLQSLQSDCDKLQEAGLYCLTKLSQSATHKKQTEERKAVSRIDFFDNLPSPFVEETPPEPDSARTDCQPAYMAEEYVKVLMELYKKQSIESKMPHDGESWSSIAECLSSVVGASARCRLYGVHRQLPRTVLGTLQAVRDRLMVLGSTHGIRNAANNPLLNTLQCLLTCITCQMVECQLAKEAFADDNLALSLNRLWPWCMLSEQLRTAVVHLLVTFSNGCPKAWAAMSMCVAGRNLVAEVCALASKEASLHSLTRPDTALLQCLRTLRQLTAHHHCRAIILKSEVLLSVYKSRVRERGGSEAGVQWARLCEAAARHADGAGAVLALRPLRAAPPVRAQLMPAIAHVARHRRSAVLQAPDLIELLSGTLLAGDTAEVVSAARAVWALAANNHKAKLLLRSSGVVASVQSAVQRMQRMQSDTAAQRALQLLIYTNNVLQST